jgi:hydroxymethylglutaryl-CoA reductase (NADPH)
LKEEQIKKQQDALKAKSDEEILGMVSKGQLQAHALEKSLGDTLRAVKLRRQVIGAQDPRVGSALPTLPVDGMDYNTVVGACCENVIG